MTTGKAAHITAAALNGPRYDGTLTREQRRHISNGFWACATCADIIDKDYLNYSVETLLQFKLLAERDAHEALFGAGTAPREPTTFIGLGFGVVAEAVWLEGSRDEWRFAVKRFVEGDVVALRAFVDGYVRGSAAHFIAVESQGDARLVANTPRWETAPGRVDVQAVLTLPITRRSERRDPNLEGVDLKLVDGDLAIENGDLALVSGIDAAKQRVWMTLATRLGEMRMHPGFGSRWRVITDAHSTDQELLGRLLLLDAARLVNVPQRSTRFERTPNGLAEIETFEPALPFVERFESVRVIELEPNLSEIVVDVSLLWASTGDRWKERLTVPLPAPVERPAIPRIDPQ